MDAKKRNWTNRIIDPEQAQNKLTFSIFPMCFTNLEAVPSKILTT